MRRPAAIALLVAVVVAGCGYKKEPTGALGPTFPVTVRDAAGRSIRVTHAPATILVLDPAGAKILRGIGVKLTLLAPDAPIAQLRARHPDLLVLPPDTSRGDADTISQRVGAPAYVLAGFQLQLIEQGAAQLGIATGHALAGRNLALALRDRRLRLVKRIESAKPQTVFVDTGFEYAIGPGDLLANLVKAARGTVVGAAQPQPVSAARMRKLAPDVYLIERSSKETLKVLRHRRATKDLAAVRSGRVLILNDHLVEPDQDAYRALELIARFLHPESLP
ncbi:MAG: cobalamin transport system substrate-binding protein [Gaiellales bacterium]|nr:cobalamin transport system substrate-binding protein [Gaiellales bacterium]